MKIDTEKFYEFIKERYPQYPKLVSKIFTDLEEYLPCSGPCGKVLHKTEFHKSKTFPNRGFRMTICKTCLKEKRKSI